MAKPKNVDHIAQPTDTAQTWRSTCVVCGRRVVRLTGGHLGGREGRTWRHQAAQEKGEAGS